MAVLGLDARTRQLTVVHLNAIANHGALHGGEGVCRAGACMGRWDARLATAMSWAQRAGRGARGAARASASHRTGGHLVAQAAATAVDHDAHLAGALNAHLVGGAPVVNLVHDLDLGVVVSGAECAELSAIKPGPRLRQGPPTRR